MPSLALGTNILNLQPQFPSLRSNRLSLKWLHNLSFITQNSENSIADKLTTASKQAARLLWASADSIIKPDVRLFLISFTFFVFVLNFKFPWIHWVAYQSKKSQNVPMSPCSEILLMPKSQEQNPAGSQVSPWSQLINNPNPQSTLSLSRPETCPSLQQTYFQACRHQPEKDKVAAVTRHCCQECVTEWPVSDRNPLALSFQMLQ